MTKRQQQLNNLSMKASRLERHRIKLLQTRSDMQGRLKSANPALLVAGGLLAGLAVQKIGWRSAYAIGLFGYRHFSDQS